MDGRRGSIVCVTFVASHNLGIAPQERSLWWKAFDFFRGTTLDEMCVPSLCSNRTYYALIFAAQTIQTQIFMLQLERKQSEKLVTMEHPPEASAVMLMLQLRRPRTSFAGHDPQTIPCVVAAVHICKERGRGKHLTEERESNSMGTTRRCSNMEHRARTCCKVLQVLAVLAVLWP